MRWRNFVIALLLLASGAGWAIILHGRAKPSSGEFAGRRLAFLERENARLLEQIARQQTRQQEEAEAQGRSEIEKRVTALRDLSFTQPITYRQIPRSDLPKILEQKLRQQIPDKEFGDSGVALAALGLLPPGIDLKKTYFTLLGEQIGAFYDQHTQEVFTFSGQPLSNSQNRVILAHELTHALEDQHFHLTSLPLETKGNDDRAMAASALVEGDATLVMNKYLMENLSGTVLKDTLASSFTTDVRQLAAAPRFLRETLLFPYLKGQVFCQELFARGGWPALAQAFRQPPSCTAQILHPERFLANPRQEPVPIQFGMTTVAGQTPLVDNVLGEFGVRELLKGWADNERTTEISAGWAGDRYLVYGDAKASSYVWRSVWTSEAAAKRFAEAASGGWRKRYGIAPGAAVMSMGQEDDQTNVLSARTSRGRELRIFRSVREVTLLDAQDQAWAETLLKTLAALPGEIAAPHVTSH